MSNKRGLYNGDIEESSRKVRTERNVSDYKMTNQHRHIYDRPDMYIESVDSTPRKALCFNAKKNRLAEKDVTLPLGVARLFLEILSNAGDNVDFTRRNLSNHTKGNKIKNIGTIDVTMDSQRVTIRNGGCPIPIAPIEEEELIDPKIKKSDTAAMIKEKEKIIRENEVKRENSQILVPQRIFGSLLTSSNYDSSFIRTGCGKNGLGAKLANIFSHEFTVKIGDPIRGQEFEATWKDNMTVAEEPICTPGYKKKNGSFCKNDSGDYIVPRGKKYTGEPYCEISYLLDFRRFGYKEYPKEAAEIFSAQVLLFSLTCKIVVSFNGVVYDMRQIRNYAKLLFDEEKVDKAIVHFEWPLINKKKEIPERFLKMTDKRLEKVISNPENEQEIPMVELLILDTPHEGTHISAVNGLLTLDGTHVSAAYHSIGDNLLESINKTLSKKSNKEEKKISLNLNISHVKNHVSIVLNTRYADPKHSDQAKTKLTSAVPAMTLSDSELKKIEKWDLITNLNREMEAKVTRAMAKTDGKKRNRKHITSTKGEDANCAGTARSQECVLYWVEGDSAASYPKVRISLSKGGKDLGGYFPGKGKFINVSKANAKRLLSNNDILNFKKFTGLFEGADLNDPKDLKFMRYGKIVLTADSDKDGDHIRMLWLNYLYRRFPSLIQKGMVAYLHTPYARVFKNSESTQVLKIAQTKKDLDDWLEENPGKSYRIKYYKGLGCSSDKDIKGDLDTALMITVVCDKKSLQNLDIAFGKGNENLRKKWISDWRESCAVRDVEFTAIDTNKFDQTITQLTNTGLVEYTLEALFRAIPSSHDGLKDSQRKALYGGLRKWPAGSKSGPLKTTLMTSFASGLTHYQHGDTSLSNTFIMMAQRFVGRNNLNYFEPDSQMGSRHQGGGDHAEDRYTSFKLAKWVNHAFVPEFLNIVDRRISEGEEVEPEWLPCVLPMHLINGCRGVATGYSTFIPCHSPMFLLDELIKRCSNKKSILPDFIPPYYHEFTGEIVIKSKGSQAAVNIVEKEAKSDSEENSEDEEEEQPEITVGRSVVTYGVFTVKKNVITITDLPVGMWTLQYRKKLEKMLEEGKIEDFVDRCKPNTVYFEITGFRELNPELEITHESLGLVSSQGLNNMNLIDSKGYPIYFKNTKEIFENYYDRMLSFFDDLRNHRLEQAKKDLKAITERRRFVQAVLNKDLIIQEKSVENIHASMDKLKLDHKYLDIVQIKELSSDGIKKHDKEIERLQNFLIEIENSTCKTIWLNYLQNLKQILTDMGY